MADVDLLVQVTNAGVQEAITRLEALKNKSQQTAAGMSQLATATAQAMRNIDRSTTGATGAIKNFDKAFKGSGEGAVSLTRQLKELQEGYREIGNLNPNSTAAKRLTLFGNGDLERGREMVALMQRLQLALRPDAQRDALAVEKEQLRVAEQRLQKARDMASYNQAQRSLGRARYDLAAEERGITQAERATLALTRAKQDLARAEAALKATAGTGDLAARTKAMNDQERAIRAVISAQRELTGAHEAHSNNAFQSSYSYFILAGLATQASQAIFGLGTATITASSQIERSFADVERTFDGTNQQLESLQQRLTDLSTETPISVVDLSQIATLGNQLGVAAEDIEGFTTTIAQYTAVSGQSAEDAATAFGRISNLTGLAASEYSNLASAITFVARTTVATEATIQNTAKEISALSAGAGFSADAIVGLAGALSSLAIPPERARGALSLYFGALNSAVAEGGPKLQAFADLTGKTVEELDGLVRQNRGQEVFTAFIQGLSQLDTVAKTTALDTLGLSTIRVDQTMRALSQNVPLVTSAFEGASAAFQENTEIANQYAIIQDTLASRFIEFQNAVQNAAGAVGDQFAPAAKVALEVITGLLEGVQEISKSPLGAAFIQFAVAATTVIAVMAALVGALALAKASMVVLAFAVNGLGWVPAMAGIRGYIATLLIADKATRAAALSQTTLSGSLLVTTKSFFTAATGAKALTGALSLLKIALPILAITAAIAAIDGLAQSVDEAINPSKLLTDDLSGLKDALIADNPNALGKKVEELSLAAGRGGAPISDFNASILSAIEIQERAEGAFGSTNEAIDAQAFALGETSKAWIAEALKAQKDIADILDGKDFWEASGDSFWGDGSGDDRVSRDDFKKLILGGLDINQISQIAITQGKEAAVAAYDAWRQGYESANPGDPRAVIFRDEVLPNVLNSVTDAYGKAAVEAALAGTAIEDTGIVAAATADEFDSFGNYIGNAITGGEALAVTFSGVTSRIDEFRDAVQGAIQGTVGFDSVLERAQAAASALAEATGGEVLPVDAAGFGAALNSATTDALKFYTDIMTLADGGNQTFALELAKLGPEAQGILSSSLELDGSGRAKLEAAARFAAFLGSDTFKRALEAEMTDSNEAYARIFQVTGDLGTVQEYIAAQVAGTGAEWERQWALEHPNLPLNVTPELTDPSDADIEFWRASLEGRLVVTPVIRPYQAGGNANTYTDTETGASITLPAELSGPALSASLKLWSENQYLTPEQIAAQLNTDGFNSDLDAWRAQNGPVTIQGRIVPSFSVPAGGFRLPSGTTVYAKGGQVAIPGFAKGGGFGQFRGAGSGTSDSLLARVSNGEFINTADATKFWGPDFFDSLNRKMIPASFMKMLSAAAVSGNQGPQSVTNVSVTQNYPQTVDPLQTLREDSENLVAGLWGR